MRLRSSFYCLFTSWASRKIVFTSYVSCRWDDGKITEALVRFSAFTSTRFNFPLLKTAGKDFCIFLKINLNCGSSIWGGGMKWKRSETTIPWGSQGNFSRVKDCKDITNFRYSMHGRHENFSHFHSWANFAFSTGKSHFWFQLIPTPLARDYNLFILLLSDVQYAQRRWWRSGEPFH